MKKEEINELERDIIEDQLADVSERLYDVLRSFEVLGGVVVQEKRALIEHGEDFRYQQGILDVVDDVGHYAKGEASLQKDTEALKEVILSQREKMSKEKENMGYI